MKNILEQRWEISSSTIIIAVDTIQIVANLTPLHIGGGLDVTLDEAIKSAKHICELHNSSL